MLNVGRIEKGIVLDHIKAGRGMSIYKDLNLDKLDCCVAIIQNARSGKIGRKDIIKIDELIELDLDILGYIDSNITVNIVKDEKLFEKKHLELPETLEARKTNSKIVMKLDEAEKFFEIKFKITTRFYNKSML